MPKQLLADENIPRPTVDALRAAGHDVLWARTDCPSGKDVDLLNRAEAESRLLLTLDKDFWQIALQRRAPLACSGVILFRVHPAIPSKLTPLVQLVVESCQELAGHITIASSEGLQMIQLRKP